MWERCIDTPSDRLFTDYAVKTIAMHEMGKKFHWQIREKNWMNSDTSEKNAFQSQSFSVLISQMGLSPLIPMKIVICCKEKYK